MKVIGVLFVAVAGFVVGAWTALPPVSTRPSAADGSVKADGKHQKPSSTQNAGAAVPRGSDELFGRVLSITQEPGVLKVRAELTAALSEVSEEEIKAIIERTLKLPARYHSILPAAIERWFHLNRAAVTQWMEDHAAGPRNFIVWEACAAQDPEGALAMVAQDGHRTAQNRVMLYKAVSVLAADEPGARARKLAELPAGPVRDEALRAQLERWAQADAAGASALFDTLPGGKLRDGLLPEIVKHLTQINPLEAFAFIERQPPGKPRDAALENAIVGISKQDPALALKKAEALLPSLSAGIVGNIFVNRFTSVLAQKDLAAARRWTDSLPPEMRMDPIIAVGREWAKTEPIAALEWAQANGVDVTRGLHEFGVTGGWSGAVLKEAMLKHPETTANWVRALPAGAERNRLLERSFQELAFNLEPGKLFKSPYDVIFTLLAELPAEAQARSARQLGHKQGQTGRLDDMEPWLALMPPGMPQEHAIAGAFQSIASSNGARAEEALESITDGNLRDRALSGLVQGIAETAPATATARALEIQSPAIRFDTLDRVVPQWLKKAPSAAQAWLGKTANVPAEWRQQWLREAAETSR
ncbi:MAG: hypothetical protein M3463_13650 [Verrucomicrobiota bacterium]|nr:hypothetical protein [Verrucomicrobiota bacterium]